MPQRAAASQNFLGDRWCLITGYGDFFVQDLHFPRFVAMSSYPVPMCLRSGLRENWGEDTLIAHMPIMLRTLLCPSFPQVSIGRWVFFSLF